MMRVATETEPRYIPTERARSIYEQSTEGFPPRGPVTTASIVGMSGLKPIWNGGPSRHPRGRQEGE